MAAAPSAALSEFAGAGGRPREARALIFKKVNLFIEIVTEMYGSAGPALPGGAGAHRRAQPPPPTLPP